MTQLQTEQGIVRVPAGTWRVDPTHSSVAFEVKHLMIATVRGHFSDFDGTLEAAEDDPSNSHAWGVVRVASIDTGNPDRDAHLRSPDFFDAERYPEMRFETTRIEHVEGGHYRVAADLTIKDTTREIEVDATVEGAAEDPWGNERVGIAVPRLDRPNRVRAHLAADGGGRRAARRRGGGNRDRRVCGPSCLTDLNRGPRPITNGEGRARARNRPQGWRHEMNTQSTEKPDHGRDTARRGGGQLSVLLGGRAGRRLAVGQQVPGRARGDRGPRPPHRRAGHRPHDLRRRGAPRGPDRRAGWSADRLAVRGLRLVRPRDRLGLADPRRALVRSPRGRHVRPRSARPARRPARLRLRGNDARRQLRGDGRRGGGRRGEEAASAAERAARCRRAAPRARLGASSRFRHRDSGQPAT